MLVKSFLDLHPDWLNYKFRNIRCSGFFRKTYIQLKWAIKYKSFGNSISICFSSLIGKHLPLYLDKRKENS